MNTTSRTIKLTVKRLAIICAVAMLIAICAVACISCDNMFVSLSSITATYNGGAVEQNAELNKDDIVVTAHYTNNTGKFVTDYTLRYDTSSTGEKTVSVTYTEKGISKTASFTIHVVHVTLPNRVLHHISASFNGVVKVGEALGDGLVVTAHYDDDSSVIVTDYQTSELDTSSAGEKTITITYTQDGLVRTCEVKINVAEDETPTPVITLESITAIYNGENIKVGGTLNNDDIAVTAYYSDDSSVIITNFAVSGFSAEKAGICSVTVSYAEDDIERECTLDITIVDDSQQVVSNSNLSIHFLELGNQYTGDCVYIKAGQTDILIDAGSRESSANTINDYISKYVTDGKLEYVIATHAHQDHIAGFVGSSSSKSILDRYQCDTLIRYAQSKSTAQVRKDFEAKCNEVAAKGVNVITALDCINNTNGGQKVYDLTEDGSITMEVLEHKYYAETSSDENDHSVCVMITQGDNHYLFTGDLEKSGEASLVQKNPNLPEMVLFKGGHHGSYTASNEVLLQKIKPQYVCICCCAGNVEYLTGATQDLSHSFPAQEMIDRIAKYTDKVYVTTLGKIKWNGTKWANDGFESMNGNIVFSCVNGEISLNCSNNNLKLKDTDWFKNNRVCPEQWASDDDSDQT